MSMSVATVNKVRSAIVKACMSAGVEDELDILTMTSRAIQGIGRQSVSAHKAWKTIRKDKRGRR